MQPNMRGFSEQVNNYLAALNRIPLNPVQPHIYTDLDQK